MKLLVFAARIMLGLLFMVFGMNHVMNNGLLHLPMMTGDGGAMMGMMFVHKWLVVYGAIEVAAGMMLFLGRFVPLALTLLAGIILNITLFHVTLALPGLKMAIFLILGELILVYAYRNSFSGIFAGKAEGSLA
jgi:putative oxidoreductase